MKKRIFTIISLIALISFTGCEDYDEYILNYDYSAVYFASQKPIRTIVAYDEMEFKVGVALGGKRANTTDEFAEFEIDPSLLQDEDIVGGNEFELLPSEYYTLSDNERMVIPAGDFIGDVTVTLNREAFTADSLATENHYALPLRITEASTDSILSGRYTSDGSELTAPKDYTIVVVKYISPYHGVYYHKGEQLEVDTTGAVIDTVIYSENDLSRNSTWDLSTIDRNTVQTSGIGNRNNGSLILDVDENDHSVNLSSGNPNMEVSGTGNYDEDERIFYLDYEYQTPNQRFEVKDTLILRQAPEKDLFFEEW